MSNDDRTTLADTQARLVESLVAGADAPAGFDPRAVSLAARTLINKRRAAVAKAWPALAEEQADRFAESFADYAAECPVPPEGATLDGRGFAEWLKARGQLHDAGLTQLVLHRATTGRRITAIRLSSRLLVAVRCCGRVRSFRIWWPFGENTASISQGG